MSLEQILFICVLALIILGPEKFTKLLKELISLYKKIANILMKLKESGKNVS